MLSAQRREFDEKKKDETPYPRDFGRWYALDYFRRPRALKSSRFYVTLGAAAVALLLSKATMHPVAHKVHQAAPVATAHAMFNQNCASCHDAAFQSVLRLLGCADCRSVSNARCNECHRVGGHHATQSHEPACASCHAEHRGHETLAKHVGDRHCVNCHGNLAAHVKPGAKLAFPATITSFNRDHPEFGPSLPGKRDLAKIRFNHKAHLGLDLQDLKHAELKGLGPRLACADCHQMDGERKYFKPIQYEAHCAQCHALNAVLVGDFAKELRPAVQAFARTPLPHREPAVVRAVLRDRLVEFAQATGVAPGKEGPSVPRPLPWKPVTESQWSWTLGQAGRVEALLFMNQQAPKAAALSACGQCHLEKDRIGGLPSYFKTAIPERWYPHSRFNHGSHRMMNCVDCHDKNAAGVKVAESEATADILLPTLKSCQECHTGRSEGARNGCVVCHPYHDRRAELPFSAR